MTTDFTTTAKNKAQSALDKLDAEKQALADSVHTMNASMMQARIERIAELEGYEEAAEEIARNTDMGIERLVKHMTSKIMRDYAGGIFTSDASIRMKFQTGFRNACMDILDMR